MQATAFLGFALVAAYADPDSAVLVNLQALPQESQMSSDNSFYAGDGVPGLCFAGSVR